MKTKSLISLILFALVACNASPKGNILTIVNRKFVDGYGREVILNGINYVNKDAQQKHISPDDQQNLTQFRDWGFNIVRFGVNWAELEPQPGVINQVYLQEIDKRVQWAKELGLWLYLDFHQDLYGAAMGNGAPQWATITDAEQHVAGEIWSDAYLLSGAVQHAFDNFWNNRAAQDSVGIQDHYLHCLKIVAQRYKDSPSVAGYDVMNEPFMGSGAVNVIPALLSGYVNGLEQVRGEKMPIDKIADAWTTGKGKMDFLEALNDKKIFKAMVGSADSLVNTFETGALSTFYQRARDSIRSTGSQQIIFLEHSYFCNLGVPSRFVMPVDSLGGADKLCCYAPHGYDLVTDTKDNTAQGHSRVEFIFEQIVRNGMAKASPVIVGEWGAYYSGDKAFTASAEHSIGIFESNKLSQTYWSYWPGIGDHEYFSTVIVRNYPMATNGKLVKYANDFAQRCYSQRWEEFSSDGGAVTRVFVKDIDRCDIRLLPVSEYKKVRISGSRNGYLDIQPRVGRRELDILVK
ncbi:MAG: cellulase family glycosylhydrolase [Mucinivorans sp.]